MLNQSLKPDRSCDHCPMLRSGWCCSTVDEHFPFRAKPADGDLIVIISTWNDHVPLALLSAARDNPVLCDLS